MPPRAPWPSLLAAAAGVLLAAPAAAFSEREAARGNTLFDRAWAAGGDRSAGLGPLFNARSCGECHPRGGGGDPTGPGFVLRLPDDPVLGRQLQTAAVPGLSPRANARDQAPQGDARARGKHLS